MTGARALGPLVSAPRRALVQVLVLPIRLYQLLVSPLLGPRCRFYPSCSAYALTAIRTRGPVRGTWLAGRRLLRCHPWNAGGIDEVPGVPASRSACATTPAGADPNRRAPQGAGT